MVSPIENRTVLTGVVMGRVRHPEVDRWDLVRLRVITTAGVAGYPDLLSRRLADQAANEPGDQLVTVAVDRSELPTGELLDRRLRGQVSLAGPEMIRAVGGTARLRIDPPDPA